MNLIPNVYYCDIKDENHLADIYLPEAEEFPVMIYFHGGGIENGNKSEAEATYKYLAENGVATVSVNYRMYPNAKYPEFIEDCAAAVSWAMSNMNNYGKCKGYYICGTSAGAYFSMMLCFNDKFLKPYGISPTDIDGYIHNAGQPTVHFNVLKEKGIDSRRAIIDESAPLFHIGTSEDLSPMLFLVSDDDMACRYEQLSLTVKTIEHFGYDMSKVEMKVLKGKHCNYVFPKPDDNGYIFGDTILDFINKW